MLAFSFPLDRLVLLLLLLLVRELPLLLLSFLLVLMLVLDLPLLILRVLLLLLEIVARGVFAGVVCRWRRELGQLGHAGLLLREVLALLALETLEL